METSEKTQPFKTKTLIAVLDGMHGRFFIAKGHSFEEYHEMKADGYPLEDDEKNVTVNRSSQAYETLEDEQIKNRVRKSFLMDVADYLLKEHQHGSYETLIVTVPKQYTNEFQSHLHNYVKEKLHLVIPKVLTRHETADILKHVQAEL